VFVATLVVFVLVISGCGQGKRETKAPFESATVKRCLENRGVAVDTTGKKFPLPSSVTASTVLSQLQILEFTLPVGPKRPTDKVALFFYDNPAAATAAMKQLRSREPALIRHLHLPATERTKLLTMLKRATEQEKNVTVSWANFGGAPRSERLVRGCLRS
jgi:hypothetical protein